MDGRKPGSSGSFESGFQKVEAHGSPSMLVYLEGARSPGKIQPIRLLAPEIRLDDFLFLFASGQDSAPPGHLVLARLLRLLALPGKESQQRGKTQ